MKCPSARLQVREQLQKFFFPQDYQEQQVTKPLLPKQRRIHTGFDLKITFQAEVAMDILFLKNEETSAIHVCAGANSSVQFYQPWTVNEFGYTSTLLVQLQKVEMTTSLEFRKLLECKSLEAEVIMTIPRICNQFQRWTCEMLCSETTFYFVYQSKDFIQDLINDWAVAEPADIAYFVPYEWEFKFYFRDYEMIWLVNEHNWIDCTNESENGQLAFCGEILELEFTLPFKQFLPKVEEIRFFIRSEMLILRSFLPDSNTLRRSVASLARNSDSKLYPSTSRLSSLVSDTPTEQQDQNEENNDETDRGEKDNRADPNDLSKGWRRKTGSGFGWIDVWSVPFLALNLFYKYHPIHVTNEFITSINKRLGSDVSKVDPSLLEPDLLTVELEAGPSSVRLLGSFFRQFIIGLKENYFGVSQKPMEFNAFKEVKTDGQTFGDISSKGDSASHDSRYFRPFEANISVVLLDIHAELSKHCSYGEPSSPVLHMERLTFEMNKTFRETRLQLITAPATIVSADSVKRHADHSHLSKGFVSLSGLQFRGHAMFSDEGIPVGADTLEYAWLMEIQCGNVTGKITLPQLQAITSWAELFTLHGLDSENNHISPNPNINCQHGMYQKDCDRLSNAAMLEPKPLCPTESDLKYRMTRVSVESVDVFIVETECACNIKASPIRLAVCTSHANNTSEGTSILVNDLTIRQYIQNMTPPPEQQETDQSTKEVEGAPEKSRPSTTHSNNWLEVAVAAFGPITADIADISRDHFHYSQQLHFLREHDTLLKRLWFLWKPEELSNKLAADRAKSAICGCVGGCKFFGSNVNGVKFFTTQTLDAGEGKFSRYGSESLWGGSHEKQGMKKRMIGRSGSVSIAGSSLGLRKKQADHRRSASLGGRLRSQKDFGSIGVWSSTQGTPIKRSDSMLYRNTQGSKIPLDRSRSREVDKTSIGGSSFRGRTESEGTFYSCESDIDIGDVEDVNDETLLLDDYDGQRQRNQTMSNTSFRSRSEVDGLPMRSKVYSDGSIKSLSSAESFVSAVASKDELVAFDVPDGPVVFKALVAPAVMSLYAEHMHESTCMNWRHNISEDLSRKCSLLKNLKAISLPVRHSTSSILPNFRYGGQGKLPFVVINNPTSIPATDDGMKTESQNPSNKNTDTASFTSERRGIWSLSVPCGVLTDGKQTIANVKIHQHVNVIVTPLLLEALERYTQSLKHQDKLQHPGYVIDSLHLSCIGSSKQRYGQTKALSVLESENDKMIDARKLTLSKLFPRKHLNLSVVLPQINFIALQVSAEQFSPSEQSSLSGQCGSKVSVDFDSSKNSCTTVLIASISKFQSMFISDDEDPSVQNAKLLILQRCSLFMSSKDLAILNSFQSDNQVGLNGRVESVDVQLQRLSHPRELRYANNVTAVKPCRSMVNFTLHRGEEADVDDLSWLEPRSSDPIGHIMMECGIEKVSISALERLQSLSSKESEDKTSVITASPDKLSPRVKSRSKESETEIQVTESKDSVSETGSTNKYEDPLVQREPGSVSLESPGIELTEIISSSPIPSPNLLKDQLEGDTDHFALGIDPKHNASGSLPSESDDATKTLLKSSKKSKEKSSRKKSGKASKRGTEKDTSKLDVIEERSRTESTEEKEKFVLHSQKQGEITIKRVWFNLATPERLKVLQEGADHDVNLLTSLVPAVCSWIPAVVDLQRSVGLVKHSYRKWRYSVLACAMGQSLPENGRLLVKHNITTTTTNLSTYLQEEYSSQLIYALRKHLVRSRLTKLEAALEDKTSVPKYDVLEKGIHALARQWKCIIIGAEGEEKFFQANRSINRKHVVGRGVLPDKDLAFLIQDSSVADKEKETEDDLAKDQTSVGQKQGLSQPASPILVLSSDTDSEKVALLEPSPQIETRPKVYRRSLSSQRGSVASIRSRHSSSSSGSDSPFARKDSPGESSSKQKEERQGDLNLYNWLSTTNSPTHMAASPSLRSPLVEGHEEPEPDLPPIRDGANTDLFRTMSPIVSVPTSGMQLAEAKEVFKAIFHAVGLQSRNNYVIPSESCSSGSFSLNSLDVNIVENNEGGEETPPGPKAAYGKNHFFSRPSAAFCLERLQVDALLKIASTVADSSLPMVTFQQQNPDLPKELQWDIQLGHVTQVVNIAIIRLVMQLTETFDMVKEEKRFAQKIKSLEMLSLNTREKPNESPEKVVESDTEMPKSWRTMYNVLDLYATNPAPELGKEQVEEEIGSLGPKSGRHSLKPREVKIDIEEPTRHRLNTIERGHSKSLSKGRDSSFRIAWKNVNNTLGVVHVDKIRFLATIGGMSLETDVDSVNLSVFKKFDVLEEKFAGGTLRRRGTVMIATSLTDSISGHVNGVKVILSESVKSYNQNDNSLSVGWKSSVERSPLVLSTNRTIATCKISQSHALFSSKKLSNATLNERTFAVVGPIKVDVPQHPGILRSVTARFTNRLQKHFVEIDNYRTSRKYFKQGGTYANTADETSLRESVLSNNAILSFRGKLESITLGAVLLPSLRVEYKVGKVSGYGSLGKRTKFHIKMPYHGLHFDSKMLGNPQSIDLPYINVTGEYVVLDSNRITSNGTFEDQQLEFAQARAFLPAVADIGYFEQNLTTDLLNHLIYLQKGFIKEVNEVIKDADESEPVSLWRTSSATSFEDEPTPPPLLYSVQVNLKGIQVTATTPSATAVRLHTGVVALELSNRSPAQGRWENIPRSGSYMKLFGRAEVDLILSLGQFNRNRSTDNDQDFESFAYFKTRIGLSNQLQVPPSPRTHEGFLKIFSWLKSKKDRPIFHHAEDKETVIITISKPQIYVMPVAVDKGLLLYLHYKNAYDYWNEQAAEIQQAAQHIWERLPQRGPQPQLYGSLFLQLNVDNLGLCIPLIETTTNQVSQRSSISAATFLSEGDPGAALVMTVEETSITCCSSGSFVSRGLFRNFCVRFADNFDNRSEEWSFSKDDIMNTCSVPEGTYSLCSRTIRQTHSAETSHSGKWIMNVLWKMRGLDMHFDTNIGKRLSALGKALTAFTGEADIADLSSVADIDDMPDAFEDDGYDVTDSPVIPQLNLSRVQDKEEGLLRPLQAHSLERQLWEQTRRVSELRRSLAPQDVISREMRILSDIETALSSEFFKDVRRRFRRRNRKSLFAEQLFSPKSARKLSEQESPTPQSRLARRHSSTDNYLETRELEYPMRRPPPSPAAVDASKRFSMNEDTTDLTYVEIAGFTSDPDFLGSYEREQRKEESFLTHSGEEQKNDEPDAGQIRVPPRVTFSDSTADVTAKETPCYKHNNSSSSVSSTTAMSMLDFELDVVVDIDSGKCVLHTENEKEKEEERSGLYAK